MTQKSHARRVRDTAGKKQSPADRLMNRKQMQKRTNTCWDDLEQSSQSTYHAIATMSNLLGSQIQTPEIIARLNDRSVIDKIEVLSNDITSVSNKYLAIRDKHKGKIGGSDDADEVMQCFGINVEYSEIVFHIDQVIIPMMSEVANEIGRATVVTATEIDQVIRDQIEKGENVSPEASAFVSAIDKARETNNGSVEYILDEKEEVNGQ